MFLFVLPYLVTIWHLVNRTNYIFYIPVVVCMTIFLLSVAVLGQIKESCITMCILIHLLTFTFWLSQAPAYVESP